MLLKTKWKIEWQIGLVYVSGVLAIRHFQYLRINGKFVKSKVFSVLTL